MTYKYVYYHGETGTDAVVESRYYPATEMKKKAAEMYGIPEDELTKISVVEIDPDEDEHTFVFWNDDKLVDVIGSGWMWREDYIKKRAANTVGLNPNEIERITVL